MMIATLKINNWYFINVNKIYNWISIYMYTIGVVQTILESLKTVLIEAEWKMDPSEDNMNRYNNFYI